MKKDKLYTVNKWNKPKFAQNVDRVHNNIFDGLENSFMQQAGNSNPYDWSNYSYTGSFDPSSMYANSTLVPYGYVDTSGISNEIHSIANPEIKTPEIKAVDTPSKPKVDVGAALNKAAQIGSAALSMYGSSKSLATPQGKGKLSGIKNQVADLNNYRISTTNLDAIDQVASNFKPLKTNYKWKDFYADGGWLTRPYTYDAGGRMVTGTLGNTFNGAATAASVSGGNPYAIAAGAAIGLGSGIVGSIIGRNRAKGMAREANRLSTDANNGMYYKIDSAVDNAKRYNALNLGLNTPYAYGGIMDLADSNMGATELGLFMDRNIIDANKAQNKGNMVGYLGNISSEPMTFAKGGKIHINPKNKGKLTETARRTGKSFSELAHSKNPLTRKRAQFALNARHFNHKHGYGGLLDNSDTFFALGGDLQANGGDYSDGLIQVNAGQSHEENPYDGVQMGIAPDNTPNLVEEGETIFNDYVFSNRIHPNKDVLKKFRMYSKGGKLTYADVSKKLEKEAAERPNDPISRAALKKMLEQLEEAQENQKAEEEAKRAREAFEALSPEEQQQVLAQIAAQQAQNGGEEVPVDEYGNPVGQQVDEQGNPVEEVPQEVPQEMQGYAEGGVLNLGHRFDTGGKWKNTLSTAYKILKADAWNKLLQDAGYKGFDFNNYDDTVAGNTKFINDIKQTLGEEGYNKILDQLAEKNASFTHALRNGYAFDFNKKKEAGYDWDTLFKNMSKYDKSLTGKKKGNNEKLYYIDNGSKPSTYGLGDFSNLKALEGDPRYSSFTKAVENVIKANPTWSYDSNGNITGSNISAEQIPYINYIRQLTKRVPAKTNISNLIVQNSDGTYSFNKNAADWYNTARNDGFGGIAHYTPIASDTTPIAKNFYVGSDNTIGELTGTPSGKPLNTYAWVNEAGIPVTYNYFADPDAVKENTTTAKVPEKIDYLPEMSEAETLLPNFLGAGLWASGLGRPDTSGLDAAIDYSRGLSPLADYRGIGNYRRYVPKDVNLPLNELYSYSRGTDRSLRNNNGSVGALMTGLSNNAYNTMIAAAKAQDSVDQLNNAQKKDVFDSNQKTDMFNADAFNKAALANAQMQDSNRRTTAELMANAATQKMAADSNWYSAPYGMLSEIASVRNARDLQNRRFNPVIAMANAGIVGAPNEEVNVLVGNRRKKSKGGKLKKKGLTF